MAASGIRVVDSPASMSPGERLAIGLAAAATLAAGILHFAGSPSVPTFVVSAVSLALLARLVGDGTEQLGGRLNAGLTGMVQSLLGNLPELFIGIFALRQGLVSVVQSALIGSILGNSVLVLGLAFLVGGLRHGVQRFDVAPPQSIALLTLLAAGGLAMPTLSEQLHTPAAQHEEALSAICAVALLVVFVGSTIATLRGDGGAQPSPELPPEEVGLWPFGLTLGVLTASGVAAAFASDWFVTALTPATATLGLSQGFTGLVVVALAGNAVENVVGVQLMADNRPDYAISVILNSSLQVALFLIPLLVLLSFVIGAAHLTLVLAPLLLGALLLAALLGALVVADGQSTWLEGLALIALYVIIAAGYWWG